MNTSRILNLLLAAALVVLAVKLAAGYLPEPSGTAIDCILTRTSIRAYEDRPVEEAKVEQLLRAAMAAPSARNEQPWAFVVVRDRATLGAMAERLPYAKMAAEAPLAIVACGDRGNDPEKPNRWWVQDVSAATENLLLAAHAMGLGAVWTGVYPDSARVEIIRKLLGLPANIVPLNVIPIGYPAESPIPKDKWKPAKIRYDRWDRTTE